MINVLISDGSQDSVYKVEDMNFDCIDLDILKKHLKERYANFFKNCPLNYLDLKNYFKENVKISILFVYDRFFEHTKIIKDNNFFTLGDVLADFKDEIMKGDLNDKKISDKKI